MGLVSQYKNRTTTQPLPSQGDFTQLDRILNMGKPTEEPDLPSFELANTPEVAQEKQDKGFLGKAWDFIYSTIPGSKIVGKKPAESWWGRTLTSASTKLVDSFSFLTDYVARETPQIISTWNNIITFGQRSDEDKARDKKLIEIYESNFDSLRNSREKFIDVGMPFKVPFFPNQVESFKETVGVGVERTKPAWYKDWEQAPLDEKLSSRFLQTLNALSADVAGSALAMLATKNVTGSTLLGSAILGTATAESVKDEAIAHGVDRGTANDLAMGVAIPVTILEKFGWDTILGAGLTQKWAVNLFSKILSRKAAGLAVSVGTKVGVEFATEITQEEIEIYATDSFRDVGVEERVSRDVMAGIGGILGGLFIGGSSDIVQSDINFKLFSPRTDAVIDQKVDKGLTSDKTVREGLGFAQEGSVLNRSFINEVIGDVEEQLDNEVFKGQKTNIQSIINRAKSKQFSNLGEFVNYFSNSLPDNMSQEAYDLALNSLLDKAEQLGNTAFQTEQNINQIFTEKPEIQVDNIKEISKLAKQQPTIKQATEKTNVFKPTSRAKQSVKPLETIALEQSEQYIKDLEERGGGETITHEQTIAKAKELGEMPEQVLFAVKGGDSFNAVDVIRSEMTLNRIQDEFSLAVKNKEGVSEAWNKYVKAQSGKNIITAEPARATEIQKEFTKDSVDLMKFIEKEKSGDKLSQEELLLINKKFIALKNNIKKAGEDSATRQAAKNMTSVYRGIVEWGRAIKLTAAITHAVNFISNKLMYGVRTGELLVITAKRAARGETNYGRLRWIIGSRVGMIDGVRKFVSAMRFSNLYGKQADQVASKYGEGRKPAIPGVTGRVIRTPFKFLGAADDLDKAWLSSREIWMESYDKAYQEGKRGEELMTRTQEIAENPSKTIMEHAETVATDYTFQKKLGGVSKWFSNIIQYVPGGEIVVPYIKTPVNLVHEYQKRSPLTALFYKDIRNGMAGINGKAAQDEAVAKFSVGLTLTVGTISAVFSGGLNVTGAYPDDPEEKKKWIAEGRPAWSIKVGDRWINYMRFQPSGFYLAQAALLKDAWENKDEDGYVTAFFNMVMTGIYGVSQMPFVEGIRNMMELIIEPDGWKAKNFLNRTGTGMIVPNFLRYIRNAYDSNLRLDKTFLEQLKNMIPGLSKTLEPEINFLGQEQEINATFWEGLFVGGLIRVDTREDAEIIDFLDRIGYHPTEPSEPSGQLAEFNLTKEQITQYKKDIGYATREAITHYLDKGDQFFEQYDADAQIEEVKNKISSERRSVTENWKDSKGLGKLSLEEYKDLSGIREQSADNINKGKNIVQQLPNWMKALKTDFGKTLKALFTDEQLRKITNDAVIFERQMDLYKIDLGDTSRDVDHIIPLSLSGDNDYDNLQSLDRTIKKKKDKIEFYLWGLLAKGEIDRKEAVSRVKNWEEEYYKLFGVYPR